VTIQPNIQPSPGISFLWQNGSTSSNFTINQPGIYTLGITNYCGTTFQSINISKGVCKLYFPSAFTPNNDGLNDIFRARFGDNITEFHLQLFNRWGQIVFDSKKISEGWNGYFKGISQPSGEYVWIVRFKTVTDSKEQMMKGLVMLIR
jgi:gliding motility-associated-like protein